MLDVAFRQRLRARLGDQEHRPLPFARPRCEGRVGRRAHPLVEGAWQGFSAVNGKLPWAEETSKLKRTPGCRLKLPQAQAAAGWSGLRLPEIALAGQAMSARRRSWADLTEEEEKLTQELGQAAWHAEHRAQMNQPRSMDWKC